MKLSWRSRPSNSSPCSSHRTPGSGFGARRASTAHICGYNLLQASDMGGGRGRRVCLEVACKTNQLEVFHLFAPRHFANPRFVQVVSHVWVVISVHVSCWWTVLRVVCSSAHHVCLRFVLCDQEEPPLVLVGNVVSRLYVSSGGLAVGLDGQDGSPTSRAVSKGMCPLPWWLQGALWAEVFPADTQRIEGLNGQVVSAARFAPHMQ